MSIPDQTVRGFGQEASPPSVGGYQGKALSDISVSTSSFNPTANQKVSIRYALSGEAKVEVRIYDADFSLIRTLGDESLQAAGRHAVTWDGRDQDGVVVPDEAYFFTIGAENAEWVTERYDPTQYSGGEGRDIVKADIDPVTKAISYRLPVPARVLIRMGVHDGPLLNTPVDWKPRVAGEITEHWDGRDQDDMLDLLNHPRFKMLITYFTLPENSVITYGNRDTDYRAYKKSVADTRPVKHRPVRSDVPISPHYTLPRTVDYSPGLQMVFVDAEMDRSTGVPVLRDRALVRVDVDAEDRSFFVEQQYEITFFLDTEFYTEQEVGYVPFNWVWDLADVPEGEHLLTVNMSGFKDQIGTLTKKVIVAK